MILWTIQPEEVYKNIMETGIYRCDFARSGMKDWKLQYDWLVDQMINRIGKSLRARIILSGRGLSGEEEGKSLICEANAG